MKIIITLALLVSLSLSALPKTFDIRVQPTIASYSDFSVMYEPVCEGYSWAQQLAQIVSNIASIKLKNKIKLSGQQLLECISNSNDICK